MVNDIITKSGKINDYIHHIDLNAFGKKRFLSSYMAKFDNFSVILDCGTSFEIENLIKYIKKNKIPLSSIKYLITSHHHFDHNGGAWKLYTMLKKYNQKLKIITNSRTKTLLNDYKTHLKRAKRTFGNLTGNMKPIENNAFLIKEPLDKFDNTSQNLNFIDEFSFKGAKIQLFTLKTPGHTHDHQCPFFVKDKNIDFIFLGEAAGTLYHTSKLLTTPTTIPVYFNYNDYMRSLEELLQMKAKLAGFAHFGVVKEKNKVIQVLNENKCFMKEFRSQVIEYYSEEPKTKYVYDMLMPKLIKRTNLSHELIPLLKKIILAAIYGMMMDLGYRKE